MGIGLSGAYLLSQRALNRFELSERSTKRVLMLGLQDCYFTAEQLVSFLERHRIPYRQPETIELTTGFKWASREERRKYEKCIHAVTFFEFLGFRGANVHALDVSEFEGSDIVHDLNQPIDESLRLQFDLIFDGGTIEHVFSTKDALFNLCRMCSVGGIVVNHSPVDFVDHGFINVNAELFRDCFSANGFEEIYLRYVATPVNGDQDHYLECQSDICRLLQPFYRTGVYSVFHKTKDIAELTVPIQGFYRSLFSQREQQVHSSSSSGGFVRGLRQRIVNVFDSSFVLSVLARSLLNRSYWKRIRL